MKGFSLDHTEWLSFTLPACLTNSRMQESWKAGRKVKVLQRLFKSWLELPFLRMLLRTGSLLVLGLLAGLLLGCRTVGPLPTVDLTQKDWMVRQGQAVWKSSTKAPEIAGELIVATRADNSSFLQFTKTPLPFVVAQTTSNAWQIQFVPENRTFSGPGTPPRRLLWLHLGRCLEGKCDEKHFTFRALPTGNRLLEDRGTGESIEFFLGAPGVQP
jgi:hypothetical protein